MEHEDNYARLLVTLEVLKLVLYYRKHTDANGNALASGLALGSFLVMRRLYSFGSGFPKLSKALSLQYFQALEPDTNVNFA